MRLIGAAERGMELMVQRALQRKTFGKFIAQHGSFQSDLAKVLILKYIELPYKKALNFSFASLYKFPPPCSFILVPLIWVVLLQCRVELEKTRLLVLEAADQLDRIGNKKARGILAMAKVLHWYEIWYLLLGLNLFLL